MRSKTNRRPRGYTIPEGVYCRVKDGDEDWHDWHTTKETRFDAYSVRRDGFYEFRRGRFAIRVPVGSVVAK